MEHRSMPADSASGAGSAYMFLTLTTLGWAANAIISKLAVGEISPMLLVALRWLGVLLLIGAFMRGPVQREWPVLRRHLGFFAVMGALGFSGFNGLFYVAAHSTTALNLGIVQGSIPALVMVGAFFFYRTPVTPMQMVGVIITMSGAAFVASRGDLGRLTDLALNSGDALMLVACLIYAGYTVALRRRPAVSGLAMFAVMSAAALLAAIPMVAVEASLGKLLWPTATGWLIVVAVTLIPSFLSQLCFMRGVELIGPGRAGVFVNLVPVFASCFAVIFLAEDFQFYHGVALALVLGGILVAETGKPRPAR